ncbi:MAG TPA: tripartite tricarboxylate transporter substrate-binding protein [Candidatus Limnocylindrales bacterium]|nr:tripartite tricarboxylate transporter substrate-binding protein [Candidatus Limnocylindrales bacterium]
MRLEPFGRVSGARIPRADTHRSLAAMAAAVIIAAACAGPGASPTPGGSPAGSPGQTTPAASPTEAITYPESPITFVVPFAAGGPTDTVTRLVAEPMSKALGQQIIVSNVVGAGGTKAAGEVAQAAPDGYTVLMHHIGMSTAPSLYKDLPYDPLVDFKTIGLVTEVPMTIVGKKDLPPTTLQELVDYVKTNGDKVKYAHAGVGAASQLCGLLFQSEVGTKVTEVPYNGTGPALQDLVGGQVDFLCDQTTSTTPQIKAGAVKAYAITSAERNAALPDLPTTTEAGLPDVQVTVWHGLYVPKDTPDAIVAKLTEALKLALKDQNVIAKFADLGTTPVPEDRVTPEAHRAHLQAQIEFWKPIIEAAGVTVP